MPQPHQTPYINPRLAERITQTYAVMAARDGDTVSVIRPAWVQYWIEHGKTPVEIADIALGRRMTE